MIVSFEGGPLDGSLHDLPGTPPGEVCIGTAPLAEGWPFWEGLRDGETLCYRLLPGWLPQSPRYRLVNLRLP